jgi:hypothetical protein
MNVLDRAKRDTESEHVKTSVVSKQITKEDFFDPTLSVSIRRTSDSICYGEPSSPSEIEQECHATSSLTKDPIITIEIV